MTPEKWTALDFEKDLEKWLAVATAQRRACSHEDDAGTVNEKERCWQVRQAATARESSLSRALTRLKNIAKQLAPLRDEQAKWRVVVADLDAQLATGRALGPAGAGKVAACTDALATIERGWDPMAGISGTLSNAWERAGLDWQTVRRPAYLAARIAALEKERAALLEEIEPEIEALREQQGAA